MSYGGDLRIVTDDGVLTIDRADGWRSRACQHMALCYDDRAQEVTCQQCKRVIPNYIAFKHVLMMLTRINWQREAMANYEDKVRSRMLRQQFTCRHQSARRMGEAACHRCGYLMDGTKEIGAAVFQLSHGRAIELVQKQPPKLELSSVSPIGEASKAST